MGGRLAMLAVVTAGVALSGCSAPTGGATATATTRATASPGPMRVVAVATPKARTAAPGLSTTGTSWLPIVKSLTAYGQWLLADPDPALAGNVATPGCGQSALLGRQLNGLLTSNAYVRTSAATISQVIGPSAPPGGTVSLSVVAGRAAEPVLSQAKAGLTITTIPAYGPAVLTVTLTRGADSKWRLCEVTTPDGTQVPLL